MNLVWPRGLCTSKNMKDLHGAVVFFGVLMQSFDFQKINKKSVFWGNSGNILRNLWTDWLESRSLVVSFMFPIVYVKVHKRLVIWLCSCFRHFFSLTSINFSCNLFITSMWHNGESENAFVPLNVIFLVGCLSVRQQTPR